MHFCQCSHPKATGLAPLHLRAPAVPGCFSPPWHMGWDYWTAGLLEQSVGSLHCLEMQPLLYPEASSQWHFLMRQDPTRPQAGLNSNPTASQVLAGSECWDMCHSSCFRRTFIKDTVTYLSPFKWASLLISSKTLSLFPSLTCLVPRYFRVSHPAPAPFSASVLHLPWVPYMRHIFTVGLSVSVLT